MNLVIEYKKDKDKEFYQKILRVADELDHDLIGFFDGEGKESEDVFLGFPLYRMDQVHDLNYDVVLILDNMPDQYADNCHVPSGRIRNIFWLLANEML